LSLGFLIVEVSRLQSVEHTTLGMTPLDEWSVRRRDLSLTTHITHNRQTSTRRRDSNPQSQQASGRRPTPQTARPPGLEFVLFTVSMPLTSFQPKPPNPNYLRPSVCGIKYLHFVSWNIAGKSHRTKTLGSAECF
jgi:hypothetical protein